MGNGKADASPGCWVIVGLSLAASGVAAWLDVNRFVGVLIVLVVGAVAVGLVAASRASEPAEPHASAGVDGSPNDSSDLFFRAVFLVMGHLAKADGAVTHDEIRFAIGVMDRFGLAEPAREQARNLFREGASPHFEIHQVLARVRLGIEEPELKVALVGIAVRAAVVDGVLHARERELLEQVCGWLGLSEAHLKALIAEARSDWHAYSGNGDPEEPRGRGGQSHGEEEQAVTVDAYRLLQVDSTSSDAEIKQAWRKLMTEYHPDRLAAKGLPEDMMQYATDRTRMLTEAWEHLKRVRRI